MVMVSEIYNQEFMSNPPHSPTNVCFNHGSWQKNETTIDFEHETSPEEKQDRNQNTHQPMQCAMLLLPNTNEQMYVQHAMVKHVYDIIIRSRLMTCPLNQDEEWALRVLRWALEPHCSIKAPEITFFVTHEPNMLFFTKLTVQNTVLQDTSTNFRIIMT
jgi:hypothetical protein